MGQLHPFHPLHIAALHVVHVFHAAHTFHSLVTLHLLSGHMVHRLLRLNLDGSVRVLAGSSFPRNRGHRRR